MNERHYGALTGRNKAHAAVEHAGEPVRRCRRSNHYRFPFAWPDGLRSVGQDCRYEDIGVSLADKLPDMIARVAGQWASGAAPALDVTANFEFPIRCRITLWHGDSLVAADQYWFGEVR